MKNVITKLFLFAVGLLLSFNYVIFPGLTAANTFYNIGAVFFAFGAGLLGWNFISKLFDYFIEPVVLVDEKQTTENVSVVEKPKRKYKHKPKTI
jgi:cytochrome c biogenesis protein CcdA